MHDAWLLFFVRGLLRDMTILLAGGTGDLGGRFAKELRARGAPVRALVREGTAKDRLSSLESLGCEIVYGDLRSGRGLPEACAGVDCVVSSLSGLRDVIIEGQGRLLDAAVTAKVPRFIPSAFASDYMKSAIGKNRNFDWRREFERTLDAAHIAVTSILNGMFADMLTGQAPFLLFKLHRVLYWENADQPMDFTTKDDVARYTARAALDEKAPRWLRIAGDVLTARGLAAVASDVRGEKFRLLRAGPITRLDKLIAFTRFVAPKEDEVFPPWQGMQYMRDMYEGDVKLAPLDNDRYPDLAWTPVKQVLAR